MLSAGLKIEHRALFDAGRPSTGQRLHAGVKPNAFRTVHVVVTKERAIPSSETVEG